MKNTRGLVMMGVALLMAIAAVIVAARWINERAGSASGKVAVAQADIALGARLTPDMVRMVDWPAAAMPPGAVTDAKSLDTRVARTTILRGEPVMETKLAPPGTQGGLSAVVAPGKRAMTVRVNDVVGVAGFAMPGNFVDVLVNTQGEKQRGSNADKDPSISKIVLERILVLAIAQEASRDDNKPKVVNAVTLELSPEQTETLDLARSVGTLSLVLRNQVDPATATTEGATKSSMLGQAPEAPLLAAVPVPKTVAVVRRPTLSQPRLAEKVEVIKGLDRNTQQF
ncbi:Flp pilus assembly protein CpaB [Massilia sp. CF038]|uniref:Flp pilus assembly protein CpaB n=1 Tax=Massilia sp. CF038 TaxID=1881045 RepID=UPI0009154EE2|nr:Flp pilus assembly protein CpaB [Massilia sp. CF038]SHG50513.1 pilus assembly protein CpaB [Massilia sp. CF038]